MVSQEEKDRRIAETYKNSKGDEFKIIKYINNKKIKIKFNNKVEKWVCWRDIGTGAISSKIPKEELIGKTFGQLQVLKICTDKRGKVAYECLCSCGRHVINGRTDLESGRVKSCGCNKKRIRANKATGKHYAYISIKSSANTRKIEFDLTEDEVVSLIQEPCYYCGTIGSRTARTHDRFKFNGLDRIDNNIGYKKENVVSCCSDCNYMKKDKTQTEFYEKIQLLQKRFTKEKILLNEDQNKT